MIACFLEKLDVAEKAVAESDVFRIYDSDVFIGHRGSAVRL